MKGKKSIPLLRLALVVFLVGCSNDQQEEIPFSNQETSQASLVNEEPSKETVVRIENIDQVFVFRVQTPTSKRSVGGNFESGGVETPPDYPKFQLAETSSLKESLLSGMR